MTTCQFTFMKSTHPIFVTRKHEPVIWGLERNWEYVRQICNGGRHSILMALSSFSRSLCLLKKQIGCDLFSTTLWITHWLWKKKKKKAVLFSLEEGCIGLTVFSHETLSDFMWCVKGSFSLCCLLWLTFSWGVCALWKTLR